MEIFFCVWGEKKQRVDMYLSTLFEYYSRSYIQKLIDSGKVRVNGKIVKKNIKISSQDEILIRIETQKMELLPEDISLDIIYEDGDMVVINKDPGIVTHPTPGEDGKSGTLVNALLYHIKDLGGIGGVERPGIVHRLDKDTSGAIMIAKTDAMMQYLQKLMRERKNIKKYYLAVVIGKIVGESFEIKSFIGRDPHSRLKQTIKNPINPKEALSIITPLQIIDDKYSLVEVELVTGRTHQIRVHMQSIGHPIVGDSTYGNSKENAFAQKIYGLSRQALHAYRLEIQLPQEKKTIIAPLKPDMEKIIGSGPYGKKAE